MKTNLLTLFLMIYIPWITAQEIQVSGKVTDQNTGESIPGVNVVEKGTNNGTITGVEGNYSFTVQEDAVLVFSFVGMKTIEIPVNNQSVINVAMQTEVEFIDEIVVIGYGTKKKRDVIGSVSKVQAGELAVSNDISLDNALQGRAAGVQVTSSSGVPGAPVTVKVRGINSITANTDPLWIVDGHPVYTGSGLEYSQGTTGQNPMSMINPKDIESIDVLKGAAATSIYGSRGANGVIIITTKSAKGGEGRLTVDFSTGISDLTKKFEDIGFANTLEYFQLADIATQNATGNPDAQFVPDVVLNTRPTFSPLTREQAMNIETDWMDQVVRQGSYQDLNINNTISGEQGTAYMSLGYRRDKSVSVNNDLQRISARLNASLKSIKNLTTDIKLSVSYSDNDRVKSEQAGAIGTGGGSKGGFSAASRGALTWFPIYDPTNPTGYWSPASGVNLTAAIDRNNILDKIKQFRSIGGLYFEYATPLTGLNLRSEISYDYIQNNSELWVSQVLTEENRSYAVDRATTFLGFNYNLFANYQKTIGNHSITAVIGTESQRQNRQRRHMEAKDLVGSYQELGRPKTYEQMYSQLQDELYLRSYFSRATYKLFDRYLIGFSFRADGSSKFTDDYRWGYFPAGKVGWIISDEPFLQNITTVNMLKIRGSYGLTGNQSIPNNLTYTEYDNNTDNRYNYPTQVAGGTRARNIGNPTITWETAEDLEVGIDYGFLENRIYGSVVYFNQYVSDLLLSSPLPPSTGLSGGNRFWDNIGDMKNWGWEFEISSVNINKPILEFSWNTQVNLTFNNNEVISLIPEVDRSGKGMMNSGSPRIFLNDYALNTYFMAEYAGIDPEKGVEMIYEIDYDRYVETGEVVKTGRKIPATLTNVQQHRVLLEDKTSTPQYYGGVNNTIAFKGFNLDVHFTFSGGNYIYNYNRQRTSFVHNGQNLVLRELLYDAWREDMTAEEKANVKYPRIVWNSFDNYGWNPDANDGQGDWVQGPGAGNYTPEQRIYSKYLYKADYIRLKTLRLGYTFPESLTSRLKINNLMVYISGTNLLTITDYPGYDPEFDGWQVYSVPLPHLKTYSFGINVSL